MTEKQLVRISLEWSFIAKEDIRVEYVAGICLYALCSEIGALRLAYNYMKQNNKGDVDATYSENLNSWFFRMYSDF